MQGVIRIQAVREKKQFKKNINPNIPRSKFVVTGPTGSGKSMLAFGILQRECQRQYMESSSLSGEAIENHTLITITGLSPSISSSQHAAAAPHINWRPTVKHIRHEHSR